MEDSVHRFLQRAGGRFALDRAVLDHSLDRRDGGGLRVRRGPYTGAHAAEPDLSADRRGRHGAVPGAAGHQPLR